MPNEADILTESEAAKLLGVEPRTLRLWRNTRGLPHYKITSKVIRYRRSELNRWLDRCRVQTLGLYRPFLKPPHREPQSEPEQLEAA